MITNWPGFHIMKNILETIKHMLSSYCWQHQPLPVLDNDKYKLLYDFTDKRVTTRRPDMVYINKRTSCGTFIDVMCVMDRHVIDKHREKIENK